jgi:hypothetical protein
MRLTFELGERTSVEHVDPVADGRCDARPALRDNRARGCVQMQARDALAVRIGTIKLLGIVQTNENSHSVTRVAGGKEEGGTGCDEAYREEDGADANDDPSWRGPIELCDEKCVSYYVVIESRRISDVAVKFREWCVR